MHRVYHAIREMHDCTTLARGLATQDNFTFVSDFRKIRYGYEITAAAGSRIALTFTTGDRHFTGKVELRKTGLRLQLDIDSALNTSWRRVEDEQPAK